MSSPSVGCRRARVEAPGPPPVYKRCELGLGLTLAGENLAVAMPGELQLRFVLTKCPICTSIMAPFVNWKNAFKKKKSFKKEGVKEEGDFNV